MATGLSSVERKVLDHISERTDGEISVCSVIGGSYNTHGLVQDPDVWPKIFSNLSTQGLVCITGVKTSGRDERIIEITEHGQCVLNQAKKAL